MRLLLLNVKGAKSFEELKTVDGIVQETFQSACQKIGIMDDDSEVENALKEAVSIRFGDQLISFFGSILEFCRPSRPIDLYTKFKNDLSIHIINQRKCSIIEADNVVLEKLKDQLERSGTTLTQFGLPEPEFRRNETSKIILKEISYNKEECINRAVNNMKSMNEEQLSFFKCVIETINDDGNTSKLFALNAPGGSGKSFVLNSLLDAVRGDGFVALATATTGIAAIDLRGGTTLHNRFKIPLDITNTSTCRFKKTDPTGELIKMTKLLIIDEMTFMEKRIYECIDRSCREARETDSPFGGITVIFAGDWRQCLPVIPRGSRGEIVNACLSRSYLWDHAKVTSFKRNMRVEMKGKDEVYAKLLLDVGNGDIATNPDLGEEMLKLPEDLFLDSNSIEDLIDNVFPNMSTEFNNVAWIKGRAILCPTNEECKEVNERVLKKLPGESVIYRSCDTVNDCDAHVYPSEFLNTIETQGLPPHILQLKKGAVIILLRNLNSNEGHVNGTRYVINNLLPHVIDATAISGANIGAKIYIPRITLIPKDTKLPFELKRKQFPIKLAYSLTANKAQGQTLDYAGIYLGKEFFCHGQLYTAISRVGDRSCVKILTRNKNKFHVKNVVFRDIL